MMEGGGKLKRRNIVGGKSNAFSYPLCGNLLPPFRMVSPLCSELCFANSCSHRSALRHEHNTASCSICSWLSILSP